VATIAQTFDIFSVAEGKPLASFEGHAATVSSVKVYGDFVISGSDDETLKVWSLATRECLSTLQAEGLVYDLRLCENKLVAGVTGPEFAYLRIWNFKKRKHLYDIPVTTTPTRLFSLSVLPTKIYCCTKEAITCVEFLPQETKTRESRCSIQ